MDELGKKAKENILSGFQFLKGKAKETLDLQKLGGQMKTLEQRREECLQEVGQRVFVFFEMDKVHHLEESDWESIRPRIDEVKEINRQLNAIQEQMLAVKHPKDEPPDSHDSTPS